MLLPPAGAYFTLSRRSRTSSTLLLEAPSISVTSTECPPVMDTQEGHCPQGEGVGPSLQLRALASMRATEVFPTPLGPENTYAWAILSCLRALPSMRTMGFWPMRSSKTSGLHFLASTR